MDRRRYSRRSMALATDQQKIEFVLDVKWPLSSGFFTSIFIAQRNNGWYNYVRR